MRLPDVIVIGAGVVGAACAEALAVAGLRVLVLERGGVAGGTTGAGGGMLTLLTKRPGPHLRLARRSHDLLAALEPVLIEQIELRWCGGLMLARTEDEPAELAARAEALRAAGLPVELLDPAAARLLVPGLSTGITEALYSPADGQVDPVRYCAATIERAAARGAVLREGVEVEAILGRERVRGVRTPEGDLEAGAVVVAAGVWSGALLAGVDSDWAERIVPRRGVLLRSPPHRQLAGPLLLEAGYYAAKTVPLLETIAFSLQQAADGRLLLGGSRSFASFDLRDPTPTERETILKRGAGFLPELRAVPFDQTTVGLRPWTPDGLPYVGPVGPEGLWIAAGHEGDGVVLAAVTAEILAARFLGRPIDDDAMALDPARA